LNKIYIENVTKPTKANSLIRNSYFADKG